MPVHNSCIARIIFEKKKIVIAVKMLFRKNECKICRLTNDQLVCSCVLIVFSPGLKTHFKNLNSLKFC